MEPPAGTQATDDGKRGEGVQASTVRLRLRGNDLIVQAESSEAPAGDAPTSKSGDEALGDALAETAAAPSLVYDRRLGAYRTVASAYRSVKERLEAGYYRIHEEFDAAPALPFAPRLEVAPRTYQLEALEAWDAAGRRGVVVLPTGAGKTLVALLAIARLGVAALVVVPTLDLLAQWRRALIEQLGAPGEHVGTFGGGKQQLAPLTVMTYDSASIHTRSLNQFGLVIFDEAHHLPASSYRLAAQGMLAPYRLGLSATPERTDGRDRDLDALIGPVVYQRSPGDLRDHLATFTEERVRVSLREEEQAKYEAAMAVYRGYLKKRRIRITSPEDFQRFVVWPSAADSEARAAMLAHRAARRLSFNAAAKMEQVAVLLHRHRDDRVILFSEFNAVVEQISRTLLIPSITHKTPAAERAAVLDGFRAGRFTKLATGRVLNEGVDVPDANVAIVLSGTGTRREYVQRLGRILRPKQGVARLYELVSEETGEVQLTRRRHQSAG